MPAGRWFNSLAQRCAGRAGATLEEPPELPEELLELPPELLVVEALMATVATVGLPNSAAPTTDVNTTLKLLPAAAALTGTEYRFLPKCRRWPPAPLVGEKSAPAVAVPLTVV